MKPSTLWMLIFWGVQALFVVSDHYLLRGPVPKLYLMTQMFIISFTVFAWFLRDAEAIDYRPSRAMKSGVILLGVVMVPYYLIRRKGFKRAMLSFATFSAFFIAYDLYAFLLRHLAGWGT